MHQTSQNKDRYSETGKISLLLRQYHGLAQTGKALDLGCGSGSEAVFLAEKEFQVTALDNSQDRLEKGIALARGKKVEVDFLNYDVLEFKYLKGRYDLILINHLLEHLGKQDIHTLIEKIDHSLHRGGLLIGTTLCVNDPGCAELRRKGVTEVNNNCFALPNGWYLSYFEEREILELFPVYRIRYYSENDVYDQAVDQARWRSTIEFVFQKR